MSLLEHSEESAGPGGASLSRLVITSMHTPWAYGEADADLGIDSTAIDPDMEFVVCAASEWKQPLAQAVAAGDELTRDVTQDVTQDVDEDVTEDVDDDVDGWD